MSKITATWDVSLNCTCPKCEEWIDLIDADNFWDRHSELNVPEYGTPRTRDMEVECQKCNHEFKVDLEY